MIGFNFATGVVLQAVATLFIGMGIALYTDWMMTLMILLGGPIAGIGAYIEMQSYSGSQKGIDTSLEDAGTILNESMTEMKTVAAFGMENSLKAQYKSLLIKPTALGLKVYCYRICCFHCVNMFRGLQ